MKRLCVLLLLLVGCAGGLPHPTAEVAARAARSQPDVTLESLEAGRDRYVQRCSGCHNLVVPTAKQPQEWPRLVGKMAERAKLTPEDRLLIERYLVALSSP
ncbi:MAG: hypothetical protein ACJ8AT_02170 [Hyalangium sp.]|uniref:hypothetical protein n=1 Tax=Hyalangium sp. TaxID=2028555 RepID=UPI00389A6C6A